MLARLAALGLDLNNRGQFELLSTSGGSISRPSMSRREKFTPTIGSNLSDYYQPTLIGFTYRNKPFGPRFLPEGIKFNEGVAKYSKIDILHQNGCRDVLALHYAVLDRQPENLRSTITYGYDINFQDYTGRTALFLAFELKNLPLAQILIAAGADPDIANNEGICPRTMYKKSKLRNLLTSQ